MPNGKKKKGHKMATHKRKKRLRKNRHKSKRENERSVPENVSSTARSFPVTNTKRQENDK